MDMERAFVTMNIQNPRVGDVLFGELTMTREALEAFADTFDFSYVPYQVEPHHRQENPHHAGIKA